MEPMTITLPTTQPAECYVTRDVLDAIGTSTSLEITKTDFKSGDELQGAEFEISWQGHESSNATKLLTDSQGKAKCENIPLNVTVTIKETKAPSGYKLMSPNPITRNSGATPTRIELALKDDKETTGIKILKVDAETKEKLDGAVFKVYWGENSEGTQVTIANCERTCTGIPLNTQVTIEEITVPEGYDKVTIQMLTSGSTATITPVKIRHCLKNKHCTKRATVPK